MSVSRPRADESRRGGALALVLSGARRVRCPVRHQGANSVRSGIVEEGDEREVQQEDHQAQPHAEVTTATAGHQRRHRRRRGPGQRHAGEQLHDDADQRHREDRPRNPKGDGGTQQNDHVRDREVADQRGHQQAPLQRLRPDRQQRKPGRVDRLVDSNT